MISFGFDVPLVTEELAIQITGLGEPGFVRWTPERVLEEMKKIGFTSEQALRLGLHHGKEGFLSTVIHDVDAVVNVINAAFGVSLPKELATIEPVPVTRHGMIVWRNEFKSITPPRFVIDGLLPMDGPGCVAGPPGSGKSFFALAMALCVATGTSFFGRAVKAGRALYVDLEGSAGMEVRVRAWEAENGVSVDPRSFGMISNRVELDDPEQVKAFLGELRSSLPDFSGVDLLVFDTFVDVFKGDEISARDVRAFFQGVETIQRELGCAVLIVHHTPKAVEGKDARELFRGSGAIFGKLHAGLVLTRSNDGEDLTLSVAKIKNGKDRYKLGYKLVGVRLPEVGPDGQPLETCVIRAGITAGKSMAVEKIKVGDIIDEVVRHVSSEGAATTAEIIEAATKILRGSDYAASANRTQIGAGITRMVECNWLKKVGHGKYKYNPDPNGFFASLDLSDCRILTYDKGKETMQ